MKEVLTGTVKKRINDSKYRVSIDIEGCSTCTLSQNCSLYNGPSEINAKTNIPGLKQNDKVLIQTDTKMSLIATTIFYLIPALLLIGAVVVGVFLKLKDWQIFSLFLLVSVMYFFILARIKTGAFPMIIGRVPASSQG